MGTIRIRAASRLHFGLIAPGPHAARRFGGVGVMVESPSLALALAPAETFQSSGPGSDRVTEFARLWSAAHNRSEIPPCRIHVEQLPPLHSGFGVGTQLGLSVACLLSRFVGDDLGSPAELAASVHRGARSAVGTYGFFYGGLIAEEGKVDESTLSPLRERIELPEAWRWVLICPPHESGLHGSEEVRAFSALDVPEEVPERLSALLQKELLPAARGGDFPEFSRALYKFGYQAGLCFEHIQGGPYNGPRLEQIVQYVRSLGTDGVGQSSWGPTLFALCENEERARELIDQLSIDYPDAQTSMTPTANHGFEEARQGL